MTDKCSLKEYETRDCTFMNCPVWYYKDCYDSARARCLKPKAIVTIELPGDEK